MNREKIMFGMVLFMVFALPLTGSAQQHKSMMHARGAEKKGMKQKGDMRMDMMRSMMNKEIVATADGGVVLLTGNKLVKFDKDLNKVNEADAGLGMKDRKKMMQYMKENCRMQQDMMGEGEDEEATEKE
jgi:hypothetical protein